jgi:chromosome segregation ATPase
MEANFDNLKRLIEKIKTVGFFERVFSWGNIKNILVDASADLQKLVGRAEEYGKLENSLTLEKSSSKNLNETVNRLHTENEVLKNSDSKQSKQIESQQKEITILTEANKNYLKRGTELSNEVAILKQKLEQTERDLQKVVQQNTEHIKNDEFRNQEYSKSVNALNKIQDKLQSDRGKELEERKNSEIERIRKLRETWANHQEIVKNTIKTICAKYTMWRRSLLKESPIIH